MITSGRPRHTEPQKTNTASAYTAKVTAIIGTVVFAIFLCSSVSRADIPTSAEIEFGEGACQVFASSDKETVMVEDHSVWGYLESVIARLIYGER